MNRVKGKVAFISGVAGLSGIGYAIARKLASEGALLAVTDISDEVYERARKIQSLGYTTVPFQGDLTRATQVNQMVEQVLGQFGRIDILVNVAGLAPRAEALEHKRFVDLSEAEWDRSIAINLKTTFNCTKAVLPGMITQKYGKIVNISSVTGPIVSDPGTTAYSAAKGGVLGLTRALALEVAAYGITVNAVGPGWIATGATENIVKLLDPTIPLKRCGKPEEVADLVLFLASDESSYITGHMIVIDGGNIIQEFKGEGDPF